MHRTFLLLGSNLGDRQFMLEEAICRIIRDIGQVINASGVYETEPWGFISFDYFLNQVIEVSTDLKPYQLLKAIQHIEKELGRTSSGGRVLPRFIDIDILFFDDLILQDPTLIIPHPRLHKRLFALTPLAEIAGNVIHPVYGLAIGELMKRCEDTLHVISYRESSFITG